MALRTVLQMDYDILEADSTEKALEILQRHRADLVTLDVLMPGKGGLETLRDIRRSESHNSVPVIMITGHASVDSACEALRLGATDYLQKPFGIDELKRSVRNGLLRQDLDPVLGLLNGSRKKAPVDEAKTGQENLMRLGKASAAFVHDLASPLQVLTILNSLCRQKIDEPPSPDRDGELREVLAQVERLLSWSTELAKGWQTIAVPSAVTRESLDVDCMLQRVMEIVSPYATLNSVQVTFMPPTQPMRVEGDRVQIERALVNLCLNGVKASTARARTLEISAKSFQDYQVFRFTDTGLGFSPERMEEVLSTDPFSSAGKKRRGLGLFIADWIAVNHGGKLQFICEQGLGTTVELFLPAK